MRPFVRQAFLRDLLTTFCIEGKQVRGLSHWHLPPLGNCGGRRKDWLNRDFCASADNVSSFGGTGSISLPQTESDCIACDDVRCPPIHLLRAFILATSPNLTVPPAIGGGK